MQSGETDAYVHKFQKLNSRGRTVKHIWNNKEMESHGKPQAKTGPESPKSEINIKVGPRVSAENSISTQGVSSHRTQLQTVSASFHCSITWKIPSVLPGQILREEIWWIQLIAIVFICQIP